MDEQDFFEYGVLKAVAQAHEVARDAVTSIGEVPNTDSYFVICLHCRLREINAPRYMGPSEGPSPYGTMVTFLVRLLPKVYIENNLPIPIYRKYVVLSGQCEDCGHIYCAWSPLSMGRHL